MIMKLYFCCNKLKFLCGNDSGCGFMTMFHKAARLKIGGKLLQKTNKIANIITYSGLICIHSHNKSSQTVP